MADTTSLAESSQAFFCAIADYLNLKSKNLDEFLDPKDKNKGLDTFSGFEKNGKKNLKINPILWKKFMINSQKHRQDHKESLMVKLKVS